MDTKSISPAGDGFYAAANHRPDEDRQPPHGCIGGVVYIGQMVTDEYGEEVEVFDAVTCERCRWEGR